MSHLAMLMKRFASDESGAALVEYAVIFAVLIAGSVASLSLVAPELIGIIDEVVAQLQAVLGDVVAPI